MFYQLLQEHGLSVSSRGGFPKPHRSLQLHWLDGLSSYFRHLSRMTQFSTCSQDPPVHLPARAGCLLSSSLLIFLKFGEINQGSLGGHPTEVYFASLQADWHIPSLPLIRSSNSVLLLQQQSLFFLIPTPFPLQVGFFLFLSCLLP